MTSVMKLHMKRKHFPLFVSNHFTTLLKVRRDWCTSGRTFALLALWCMTLMATSPAQTINVQNAQNTVDSRMRSDARVAPATLALQHRTYAKS